MLCKNCGGEEIRMDIKEKLDDETLETSFEVSGTCSVCNVKHSFEFNWREIEIMEPLALFMDDPKPSFPWQL